MEPARGFRNGSAAASSSFPRLRCGVNTTIGSEGFFGRLHGWVTKLARAEMPRLKAHCQSHKLTQVLGGVLTQEPFVAFMDPAVRKVVLAAGKWNPAELDPFVNTKVLEGKHGVLGNVHLFLRAHPVVRAYLRPQV